MAYVLAGMIVVSVVEAVLLWRAIRGIQRFDRLDTRVAHLTDALTLLTETTEAGFRANAQELARLAAEREAPPVTLPAVAAKAPTRRATTARTAAAARPARKARTAAVAPVEMSEGERHLRLHLAESVAAKAGKEGTRAALRA